MKLFRNHDKPIDPKPLFGAGMLDRQPTSEGSPEQQARVAELSRIATEGLVNSDSLLLNAGVMRGKQAEAAQNKALAELPPVEPAEGKTSQVDITPETARPTHPEDVAIAAQLPPQPPVGPTPAAHA